MSNTTTPLRHDWSKEEIKALFDLPLMDLLFQAQTLHRQHFKPNCVQLSTLLSIKTGTCPEDCSYCSQSGHYKTGLQKEKLLELEKVLDAAKKAKAGGATRFCMAAAWRGPNQKDLGVVTEMIKAVKGLGLETCASLGMLTKEQSCELKTAGLDFYNHNLDTSPEYYPTITTTRKYQDRLDTLAHVREADIKVCCGGIMGLGESADDRVSFLQQLANLPEHPKSVPINKLMRMPGTPLANNKEIDSFEFVRTVAVARILMPHSFVRLSAGRTQMNDETQALCFFAGANSIFLGEKLLTTENPTEDHDKLLFDKLGIKGMSHQELQDYQQSTEAEACA